MALSRRQFLKVAAAVGAAGPLVACGPGSPPPPGGDNCTTSSITSNHGHSVTIPKADAEAGVAKSYSIRGSASHDHTIALSAQQMADLAAGTAVTVTSTSAGHTHDVTVSCA